ncbi:MAG: hypothetical protein RR047_01470 [Bacilli bacterium]
MSKIAAQVYLKNNNNEYRYETNAIYDKDLNILKFQELLPVKTQIHIDMNSLQITRENKELKMILTFDKKQAKIMKCELKGINQTFSFKLQTRKIEVSQQKFLVEYDTYVEDELLDHIIFEITFQKNLI